MSQITITDYNFRCERVLQPPTLNNHCFFTFKEPSMEEFAVFHVSFKCENPFNYQLADKTFRTARSSNIEDFIFRQLMNGYRWLFPIGVRALCPFNVAYKQWLSSALLTGT